MVLLGGHKIESKEGFSIWSGPDGGLTDEGLVEDGNGSGGEPLAIFGLSGLTSMSYVVERVVRLTPLNMEMRALVEASSWGWLELPPGMGVWATKYFYCGKS